MCRSLLVIGLVLCGASPSAQAQQPVIPTPTAPDQPSSFICLHGSIESPEQRSRRDAALDAAWLIREAHLLSGEPLKATLHRFDGTPPEVIPPPSVSRWWRQGSTWHADVVERESLFYVGPGRRAGAGIRWGADEPVPNWRIEWIVRGPDPRGRFRYIFRLIDTLDPCAFSYSSDNLRSYGRRPGEVPVI